LFIDVDYFDYVVKRAKTTRAAVAEACGLNRSTLYRRMKGGTITVHDMHSIIACLSLSWADVCKIFFAQKGAETHPLDSEAVST
jgi:hypothetical protein